MTVIIPARHVAVTLGAKNWSSESGGRPNDTISSSWANIWKMRIGKICLEIGWERDRDYIAEKILWNFGLMAGTLECFISLVREKSIPSLIYKISRLLYVFYFILASRYDKSTLVSKYITKIYFHYVFKFWYLYLYYIENWQLSKIFQVILKSIISSFPQILETKLVTWINTTTYFFWSALFT